MLTSELRTRLIEMAMEARQRAYAPYSKYMVGAAALTSSGKYFTGVNVENAAYPNGICAERVAVFKAVSEGEREFAAIAVVTSNGVTPCGACRQVMAEFGLDTLVIIAEPEAYAILEEVIRRLDEPRPLVYVEALIMEVSSSKALDLGVEWRLGNTYDGGYGAGQPGGVYFGGSQGSSSPVADAINTGTVSGLPAGFVAGVLGKGITLGSITFPTIAAFVRAVKTDSDFNVISTPQILTLDNEEASIEIGQNIPFVTQVVESSQTTDRPIQNFQYKDVGVTLKVTPQINEDGFIRLKIEESVKAVISQTALRGTVLAPTTTYRTAKTSIMVKDGETAVIGGLIEARLDRGKTSTPCLGDIPAFGWLFKTTSDRDEKTNLMVFMTPRVARGVEDTKKIYDQKKGYIDKEAERALKAQEQEIIRKKAFESDWGFDKPADSKQ